jgi:hypothetical protein
MIVLKLGTPSMGLMWGLKRFRNYCGPKKIAKSGFPWEKTTKRSLAFPDFLRAALTEGNHVRLSSRKAACSLMAPPSSTGNPGSVYTNCETAVDCGKTRDEGRGFSRAALRGQ